MKKIHTINPQATMTKKKFKERCRIDQYGKHHRGIFYDWMSGRGYKYAIFSNVHTLNAACLLEMMYNWAVLGAEPLCRHKMFAPTDEQRFKIPISVHFSE